MNPVFKCVREGTHLINPSSFSDKHMHCLTGIDALNVSISAPYRPCLCLCFVTIHRGYAFRLQEGRRACKKKGTSVWARPVPPLPAPYTNIHWNVSVWTLNSVPEEARSQVSLINPFVCGMLLKDYSVVLVLCYTVCFVAKYLTRRYNWKQCSCTVMRGLPLGQWFHVTVSLSKCQNGEWYIICQL